MDFKEFCKERKRMCNHYRDTVDVNYCPFRQIVNNCDVCAERSLSPDNDEAMNYLGEWVKSHPRYTNYGKLCAVIREAFPDTHVDLRIENHNYDTKHIAVYYYNDETRTQGNCLANQLDFIKWGNKLYDGPGSKDAYE